MAVSIGSLIMDLRASTVGLRKDAAKAVKEGRRLGNQFAKGVAAGAAVGAAVLTKEFAGFQKAFAEVKTITNGTTKELRALENQTTALSMKLGTDLTASAQGLYQTISAGIPKENAISFLETASKGAIAGVTDIKTSVDGLSTVVNAFKLDATETATVSDVMFTTVKNGKTTFEELSSSIADVAPIAASMNVEFQEVFAATATLTKQGTKTGVAMTQIRASLVALIKPTADMQELFKRLNVETGQQLIDQHGLQGALMELNSVASMPELAKAMGRVEGLNAVLGLTGDNAEMFAKDLTDMRNSAGATDAAFETMQNTLVAFANNVKSIVLGTVFPLMAEAYDALVKRFGSTQNLLEAVKSKVMSFVEVGVQGFGLLGDALRGWEVIIKTGRVAFAGLFEGILVGAKYIYSAFNEVDHAIAKMVNTVIDGVNTLASKIPGIEGGIARVSTELSDSIMTDLDNLAAGATSARKSMVEELAKVFDEPLPSTAVKDWLAEVKAKTTEAATYVSDEGIKMRQQFNAPIIPAVVVEDTIDKTAKIGSAIESNFTNPVETGMTALNDQVSGLVKNTQSVDDAMTNVAQTIVTTVLQSLITMGTQWLLQQSTLTSSMTAMQSTAMAASTATTAAAGGAALASWAPAAMAASIATMGGAVGAGIGSYTMGMAGGMAATVAIGALGNMANTALGIGTGKKAGGPVSPGIQYPIHEEGLPEFFKPDVSGKVIPLADMGTETHSGPSGTSIVVNQTFTGGVTEADLARNSQKTKKDTIDAILEAMSRGGQFRKMMQA